MSACDRAKFHRAMNLSGIIDFRNFNPAGMVEFVDDPKPIRCGEVNGELVQFTPGSGRWMDAQYELRHVKSSANPNIPAPCVLLFGRVEKFSAGCFDACP